MKMLDRSRTRPILLCLTFIMITAATPLLAPISVYAGPVAAGQDFFETVPTSYQDFSSTPIPRSFFDPGSDPFTGTIFFQGVPTVPGSTADTVVRSLSSAKRSGPFPQTVTIPIEIISLSLVSVNPITVTYNGTNAQTWNVRVTLSSSPQSTGSMKITANNKTGGTFDSILPVRPIFTFTRITPPSPPAVRIIDFGTPGMQAINFQAHGVPWTRSVPSNIYATGKFCASCNARGQRVETDELATLASHNILPALKA